MEGQTALPVINLPVMECWRGLGVNQVLLQEAFQNHLETGSDTGSDTRKEEMIQVDQGDTGSDTDRK